MQYFHNNTWHAGIEPLIPANDLGIARGFAVFDFLRTYNKKPFYLEEHLQRFLQSAQHAGLQIPCDLDTICTAIFTLIANQSEDIGIKILLTAGPSETLFKQPQQEQLYIYPQTIRPIAQEKKERGIAVKLLAFTRPFPSIKSTFYFPAVRALTNPFDEVLYINEQGHITEGATSNFFLVQGRRLITAKESIIQGITKDVILEHLAQELIVEERVVTKQDILKADEAFISSTSKEVLPISWIEDYKQFSSNRPITTSLAKKFTEYSQAYTLGNIGVG